jgi:hypothetical protein
VLAGRASQQQLHALRFLMCACVHGGCPALAFHLSACREVSPVACLQAEGGQPAALAQPALTVIEHTDARFDRRWPDFSAWCVRHMAADDSDVKVSNSDSGVQKSQTAASGARRHSDSSGSESD